MRKIVRIITRLNIGGPTIHIVLLTREMSVLGYETILVAGSCEAEDEDTSYLLQPQDPVLRIPEMSRSVHPWKNLRALWRLWRLMRQERPLIVHTHTAMAGCLGRIAAFLSGVPIIVHTFHGNSLRHYFPPVASRLFLAVERTLARVTDAICVVAPQQAEELSDGFGIAPRSKFRVIPLGFELDPYLSMPPPSVDSGLLTVGWLGRLVHVKNVSLLLAVVEETLRRTDKVTFLVAGDGPEGGALRDATARFGSHLVWRGWERDVPAFLSNCHILIQTSRNEGTPVALIQGMAAGRPFISTAVGGVVDMVSGPALRNGHGSTWFSNAVLAESSPGAFADALLQFLRTPEVISPMGLRGREFAMKRYSKERLLHNLDGLYRELLTQKLGHRSR